MIFMIFRQNPCEFCVLTSNSI